MVFGQNNKGKRIVISGTYSAGKTTITKELSRLTGIPPAVARGMREILPETFPGKALEDCTPSELVQLGMIRFGERKIQESQLPDGFVSDGSALHEWAYGYGRQLEGAHGRGSEIFGEGYKFAISTFGDIVKRHAKQTYTDIIHLPVEFPLDPDGHRPVSEAFRREADKILTRTWEELGFNYHVVGGSVKDRVASIINILGLDVSSTLNGPRDKGNGKLWYERSDDALVKAKVDLGYGGSSWSQKKGQQCKPHLTSIDSILIGGQLAQMLMYAQDGITRDESNNLWLRNLELQPGCSPVENVTAMPAHVQITKSCRPKLHGTYWHAASIEGDIGNGAFGIKAKIGYELPARLQPNV
jgi:hypothetical protein